jgi:hypothetical protein
MKKLLILLAVLCFSQTCLAFLPVTDDNLQAAMRYGLVRSNKAEFSDEEFLAPWTVPESSLTNPYRSKERVLVYTPYMLATLQARHLAVAKQPFALADIKKFVHDYDGITIIGAVVNTPLLLKTADFHVVLEQGTLTLLPYASDFLKSSYLEGRTKVVSKGTKAAYLEELRSREQALKMQLLALEKDQLKPDEVNTAVTTKTAAAVTAKIARIDMQYYFDNTKFDPSKPYRIVISDSYCGSRTFNVVPSKLK